MVFQRNIISAKIKGFLSGATSQTELYEWALSVAVTTDYEALSKEDPLTESVVQFLVDINQPKTRLLPIKKILQYYTACLDGEKTFSASECKALAEPEKKTPDVNPPVKIKPIPSEPKVRRPAAPARIKPASPPKPKESSWGFWKTLLFLLKVYALIFVLLSLLANFGILCNPDFLLQKGQTAPAFSETLKSSFPHIIYAIAMLIALTWRVTRPVFYLLFFISALGMFFYWYLATDFVLNQVQSLSVLGVVAPMVSLPPTAGFYIMLSEWLNQKKLNSDEQISLKSDDA